MKVVLTGATGFFGAQLLASFLTNNYQVIITKRSSTKLAPLFDRFGKIDAYNTDEGELDNLFQVHPDIDVVVHAATDYGRDISNPLTIFWANEAFPIRLLDLSIRHGVGRFVNMDTFFNSGKGSYDYLSNYTLSKRHFQEWGQHCGDAGRIDFLNLRIFHLYGPGDSPEKFIPDIVKRCLEGQEIDLTTGEQKRDFIHINDAVSAVNMIMESEMEGDSGYKGYDVGTGTSTSVRKFVETVKEQCCSNSKLNFGALPTRTGEFLDVCADTKMLSAAGWAPNISIEMGVRSVIKDLRRR